ncbi:MAG: class B sortase [Clostridia bacterium]|nr:class B sortase [Clostridia bacterium]
MKRLFRKKNMNTPKADPFSFTQETELNYDRDPFLHSLKEQTKESIPLSREPEKEPRGAKLAGVMRTVLLVICIAVCAGSCLYLIDNFRQKAEAEALYGEAAAEFDAAGLDFGFSAAPEKDSTQLSKDSVQQSLTSLSVSIEKQENADASEDAESGAYNEELQKLRALLGSYKERNEDVCGYISIPGVNIAYVVVQGEDNDFYLNHNYKGEPLVVGSIYMDYRNSETLSENYNTVLYGHNIETPGIMFHGVTDFFNKNIFDNEYIYLYTMDGVYVYKAFAIYDTRPNSGYIRTEFETAEEFAGFLAEMQSRSRIKSDAQLGAESHILTLSTCTNYNNGRYALHAYLVDYIH